MDSFQIRGQKIFTRDKQVVARKIAGEMLLIRIRGDLADMQRLFALNQVGECIWESLDGQNTLKDIRDKVIEGFDVEEEQAIIDLLEFIEGLQQAGLIIEKK